MIGRFMQGGRYEQTETINQRKDLLHNQLADHHQYGVEPSRRRVRSRQLLGGRIDEPFAEAAVGVVS
jgi:hypothetical protein